MEQVLVDLQRSGERQIAGIVRRTRLIPRWVQMPPRETGRGVPDEPVGADACGPFDRGKSGGALGLLEEQAMRLRLLLDANPGSLWGGGRREVVGSRGERWCLILCPSGGHEAIAGDQDQANDRTRRQA